MATREPAPATAAAGATIAGPMMKSTTRRSSSSPPDGDSGTMERKLLSTRDGSNESAATVEAPRVAAAMASGDMRTECDNRAPQHHHQAPRRRRRRRQQPVIHSYCSSASTTEPTSRKDREQQEERRPRREAQKQTSQFANTTQFPGVKQSLYSPIKARLAATLEQPGWSPTATTTTTSDYYSSSSSPAQNSPLLQFRPQITPISEASTYRLSSSTTTTTTTTTTARQHSTKIYENPIQATVEQQQDDDATRMMINPAATNARQQPAAASGGAAAINGNEPDCWRTGSRGTSVLLSSATATSTATAAAKATSKGKLTNGLKAGSHSNYAAPEKATDAIHAGSTCDSSSRSTSSSSSFCSQSAHKLDHQQLEKQKTARRQPAGAGAGAVSGGEQFENKREHLVVFHSSASESATANSTQNSGANQPRVWDRQAQLTSWTNNNNNNREGKISQNRPNQHQPYNYTNLRRVLETESDQQRYNFGATAMRHNDNSNNCYYYNAARSSQSQPQQYRQDSRQQQPPPQGGHQVNDTTNYQDQRNQIEEDDYHFYQVVVPDERQRQETASASAMPTSPCKSIQRIVQSLFNTNQCDQQQQQLPTELSAIPSIDRNLLVCPKDEPLIRSSSWQNRTLIDLNRHSSHHQHARQARYAQPEQQQQQEQHLYCGLGTLNRSHAELGGSSNKLSSHSFQTLQADAKQRQANFYQAQQTVHMAPNGLMGPCPRPYPHPHPYPLAGARSVPIFAAAAPSGDSFSSDSALGLSSSSSKSVKKQRKSKATNSDAGSGIKVWILIVFLVGLIACALLALYSSRPTFVPAHLVQPSENKDLYRTVGHQNELLIKANQNLQQRMNYVPSGYVAPSGGALFPPLPPSTKQIVYPAASAAPATTTTTSTTAAAATTTTISSTTISEQQLAVSTQNYWLSAGGGSAENQELATKDWCSPNGNECNLRGHCDRGQCYCLAGYSGPTCAKVNCPNECSQRGECKLRTDRTLANLGANSLAAAGQQQDDVEQQYSRAYLQSLGYETLASSEARNSICPDKLENEFNQTWAIREPNQPQQSGYDNRLEWHCQCEAGFTGSDCSRLKELRCDDQIDDDQDGLIDCEDDDCCSQPVCRDNLMCLKSPEPAHVLSSTSSSSVSSRQPPSLNIEADETPDRHEFFNRVKFLIANESVQSYAQEKAFDRSRAAVIRGKVIKLIARSTTNDGASAASTDAIVSVRVGVVEMAQFGFTLTRADGYFDMLVNGNEWLTLQFHRNAYAPIKRKIFVRALSINTLDEEIEMALLSTTSGQQQQQQQQRYRSLDLTFGSTLFTEIYRLTSLFKRAGDGDDDERKRNALFECLIDSVQQRAASFKIVHEPAIVQQQSSDTELLRTIVPVNQDAFQTHLDVEGLFPSLDATNQNNNSSSINSNAHLKLVYNSAMFPASSSVVKSVITIKLLDEQSQIDKLEAVYLRLDIEGQSKREHLQPVPNLNYQFAWNRRNAYDQKVYGFAELRVRVGYLYKSPLMRQQQSIELWRECAGSIGADLDQRSTTFEKIKQSLLANPDLDRQQVVWFERKLYLEAHQLNQQADMGKWNLAQSNRLHLERKSVYFGSGWSLPYQLVYPPTLSDPIPLAASVDDHVPSSYISSSPVVQHDEQRDGEYVKGGRSLARGPNSSMFVIVHDHTNHKTSRLIQLDSSGKRRLIDVPLSIITSKMDQTSESPPSTTTSANKPRATTSTNNDFQLIYNNYISTLYVSSMTAAKIVQVSYSSLLVLNKTSSSESSVVASSQPDTQTAATGVEEELDIEALCGFGRQLLSSNSRHQSVRSARQTRLLGPHSMTLDEEHQVLYFVDGSTNLVALDVHTEHATLLSHPSIHQQQQQTYWQPMAASQRKSVPPSSNCRLPMRLEYSDFKAHNMHSLVWIKSESSLYFVDQNTVLALRQDYSLEVVAAGPQSPWPASCFGSHQYQLGLIKSLVLDESLGELLLVHQWTTSSSDAGATNKQQQQQQKTSGLVYLARLRLGIVGQQQRRRHLFDLHSGAQTWDPMIFALSRRTSSANNANRAPINWPALLQPTGGSKTAPKSSSARGQQPAHTRTKTKTKPVVHVIGGGFKSVDSIEINSDGSIFVLDSMAHQIRLLEPYSPPQTSDPQQIYVNINSRLFGGPAEQSIATTSGQSSPSDRGDHSRIIAFVDPIYGELMEFHADTGIQLSLTSPATITAGNNSELAHEDGYSDTTRIDFYYKIFTNNKVVQLDEDDKNDLDIQRLVINYMTSSSSSYYDHGQLFDQQLAERQYVRLDKIVVTQVGPVIDSASSGRRSEQPGEINIELIRSYTGSRFVLQSIISSYTPLGANSQIVRRTICETSADYLGVLTSFRLANKDYWTDLIYDGMTYLIRDLVIKKEISLPLPASALPSSRQKTTNDFNGLSSLQQQQPGWSQLKRIVHDRVFFHYCNLFVVNA